MNNLRWTVWDATVGFPARNNHETKRVPWKIHQGSVVDAFNFLSNNVQKQYHIKWLETNGSHSAYSNISSSWFCIDTDNQEISPNSFEKCLQNKGIAYILSVRNRKWHLHIPTTGIELSTTIDCRKAWSDYNKILYNYLFEELDPVIRAGVDDTCFRLGQFLNNHTFTPEKGLPHITMFEGQTVHVDRNYVLEASREPLQRQTVEDWFPTNSVTKALYERGLVLADSGDGKLFIECPHNHPQGSKTSTVFMNGRFVCLHHTCSGRPQVSFLVNIGMLEQKDLLPEKPTTQVTLSEVVGTILPEIQNNRNISVIQVPPGAGKSHLLRQALDSQIKDVETLVVVPTNDLMEEFASRLSSDRKTVVVKSALAVLNEDGSYACKNIVEAKRAQNAGINIHRSVCTNCPYRETCTAIKGAVTYRGKQDDEHAKLVIANQVSMFNDIDMIRERFGLLVYDESPPLIDMYSISQTDFQWIMSRSQDEQMGKYFFPIISDKLRRTLKRYSDTINYLFNPSTSVSVESVDKILNKSESLLSKLLAIKINEAEEDSWDSSNLNWFQLDESDKKDIERLHSIKLFFESIGKGRIYKVAMNRLVLVRWSEHTEHLAIFGGIILDATPLKSVINSFPTSLDKSFIDLAVEDANNVHRLWKPCNLSRTALLSDRFETTLIDAVKSTDLLKITGKKPVKGVIFSHKTALDRVKQIFDQFGFDNIEWDYAHYGNVRGYDSWFQDGFQLFITVGDPIPNIDSYKWLSNFCKVEVQDVIEEVAIGELCQAHGRARAPQKHRHNKTRWLLHLGNKPPQGWHKGNTITL
jgi:hypothetical protein